MGENKSRQGNIRRFWAERFDTEMNEYLLSPINDLSCGVCPVNRVSRKGSLLARILRFPDRIRKAICLAVIGSIEKAYVGTDKPDASQIVDGCLAIKDGLSSNQKGCGADHA